MMEKLKISAVICEFNPLHMGHKLLLDQMKAISDGIVCVMSGNFVQRGEPAILDKWARTRLALQNGADLIVELPLPWACSGVWHWQRPSAVTFWHSAVKYPMLPAWMRQRKHCFLQNFQKRFLKCPAKACLLHNAERRLFTPC